MVKRVSLVKGDNRHVNVKRALELIGPDLENIANKKSILLKPNLTATKLRPDANTHVDAVRAILDFLRERVTGFDQKEVVIAEGSGSAYYEATTTWEIFRDFGYEDLVQSYPNVKLEAVEDYKSFSPIPINSFAGPENMMLADRIKDFDYKISINLPKVHNYAMVTFGIKNMMGMIRQEDKSMVHGLKTPSAPNVPNIFNIVPTKLISWMRRRTPGLVNALFKHSATYMKAVKVIHYNVTEMAKLAWPDLVVLDGLYGMDGNGPVDGYPVKLGAAIASTDPLKADGLAARLIGLQPEDVGYLYYLSEAGMGDYSLDGLVGEELSPLIKKFKMHPTFPIQKEWQ
ncbi:MAG: DUF362 domain-containing protein [Candidatus Omnitrophica bacterium]|nr:DUF362 domain-containing protein [Candidatus Omnitrophota bacterium]